MKDGETGVLNSPIDASIYLLPQEDPVVSYSEHDEIGQFVRSEFSKSISHPFGFIST